MYIIITLFKYLFASLAFFFCFIGGYLGYLSLKMAKKEVLRINLWKIQITVEKI